MSGLRWPVPWFCRQANRVYSGRLGKVPGVYGANVNFDIFSDYIALIVCLLKHVKYPKKKLISFLKEYETCINDLYSELPLPLYNKIVATGIKGKLLKLTQYVKK